MTRYHPLSRKLHEILSPGFTYDACAAGNWSDKCGKIDKIERLTQNAVHQALCNFKWMIDLPSSFTEAERQNVRYTKIVALFEEYRKVAKS